jgi:hypothetical protein
MMHNTENGMYAEALALAVVEAGASTYIWERR